MREIRLSGSEGGGANPIASPYPYGRRQSRESEVGLCEKPDVGDHGSARRISSSPTEEFVFAPEDEGNVYSNHYPHKDLAPLGSRFDQRAGPTNPHPGCGAVTVGS